MRRHRASWEALLCACRRWRIGSQRQGFLTSQRAGIAMVPASRRRSEISGRAAHFKRQTQTRIQTLSNTGSLSMPTPDDKSCHASPETRLFAHWLSSTCQADVLVSLLRPGTVRAHPLCAFLLLAAQHLHCLSLHPVVPHASASFAELSRHCRVVLSGNAILEEAIVGGSAIIVQQAQPLEPPLLRRPTCMLPAAPASLQPHAASRVQHSGLRPYRAAVGFSS